MPLSSRAALSAADFRAEGDVEFAERLMAQSGMAELTAILTDSVLERTETVRHRNVIQLARTVVTELGAADELALAAAEGDPRLETAWRDASERKRDFAATQRVGRIALADEFALLSEHLTREFNRRLNDLRARCEADVESNRLKPEVLPEGLDAEIRAVLAHLDEVLGDGVSDIAKRIATELEVTLREAKAFLGAPVDLAETIAAGADDDALSRVTGVMPSMLGMVTLPGAIGMIGGLAPVVMVAMPVAIVAGLALVPLNLVQRRRARDKQEAKRMLRTAIDHARTEIPPLLSGAVRDVRRAFERDLQEGMQRRERELGQAVKNRERLPNSDRARREEARRAAQGRLEELVTLGRHAEELDRLAQAG